MLHESIQHQIGCKRFNKRLNSLVLVYVAVGLFTLVIGIVETVFCSNNEEIWPIWFNFSFGGFSPVIILSIFFLTPSLLGHLIVHGYTQRVRVMLIVFMVLTTFSLIAAFMLSMLSILSLAELPEIITCETTEELQIPIIKLKSALPIQRYPSEEESVINSSMTKESTKCITSTNTQMIIIAIIELLLSISQLITSIIGTIIVTQIKPWKKFKVRIRTTYDRFRSLKLSCGCGGETKIGKNDFNFKQSRVNHGFKDFPIQKVCSIDDDNFLNHLESCTPTRFPTPRHSPKNLKCETAANKGVPTVL